MSTEVWRAIVKVGLDPYFGFMHGSKRDQGSLVFDLIEEFRAPFADRLVIGMLGRGFLPEIGAHGFLKTRTRRQLALSFSKRWMKKIEWRSRSIEPGAILAKQAGSIVKLINREGDYYPYRMRWQGEAYNDIFQLEVRREKIRNSIDPFDTRCFQHARLRSVRQIHAIRKQ